MANPNSGRFTWHELGTSDPAAAAKFYTGLFGWTVREMPMGEVGTYRIFSQGDTMIAGAMAAPSGVPSAWLAYVEVENVDALANKARELGGKIIVPPTTVPNMLRFACVADSQGAAFGMFQPLASDGSSSPPPPTGLGTFCWDELHVRDMAAAKKFYAGLFGWSGTTGDKGEDAGHGADAYWHWMNAGKEIGGMSSHMGGPNTPPHWLAYIAVADVDASTKKAESLGGKILMPAMDIPKVGRFSVVQDPTGGVFCPFRSARL